MVCLGNICRSPLAEGILAAKLDDRFTVDSAGTISLHEGEHPDKRAVAAGKNHGIDISQQRSRPITAKDIESFDRIYCMDLEVYKDVVSKAQNEAHRKKISLFLEAAGEHGENIEVPDPYWGGSEEFEAVYQMIDAAAVKIASKLKAER